MQLEAIYDNGKLEFSQPIQLKYSRVRLLAKIPDEGIASDKRDTVMKEKPSYVREPGAQALAWERIRRNCPNGMWITGHDSPDYRAIEDNGPQFFRDDIVPCQATQNGRL